MVPFSAVGVHIARGCEKYVSTSHVRLMRAWMQRMRENSPMDDCKRFSIYASWMAAWRDGEAFLECECRYGKGGGKLHTVGAGIELLPVKG
jgi:hypothetical protein